MESAVPGESPIAGVVDATTVVWCGGHGRWARGEARYERSSAGLGKLALRDTRNHRGVHVGTLHVPNLNRSQSISADLNPWDTRK